MNEHLSFEEKIKNFLKDLEKNPKVKRSQERVTEFGGKTKTFFKDLENNPKVKKSQERIAETVKKSQERVTEFGGKTKTFFKELEKKATVKKLQERIVELLVNFKGFFKALRRYPEVGIMKDAGVCAGVAYKLKVEVLYVRLGLLLLMFSSNFFFWVLGIAYFISMIVVPAEKAPADFKKVCDRRAKSSLYRLPSEGIWGGVCAGLAHKLRVKTLVVRAIWLMTVIMWMPISMFPVVAYLIFWVALPTRRTPKDYAEICKVLNLKKHPATTAEVQKEEPPVRKKTSRKKSVTTRKKTTRKAS